MIAKSKFTTGGVLRERPKEALEKKDKKKQKKTKAFDSVKIGGPGGEVQARAKVEPRKREDQAADK